MNALLNDFKLVCIKITLLEWVVISMLYSLREKVCPFKSKIYKSKKKSQGLENVTSNKPRPIAEQPSKEDPSKLQWILKQQTNFLATQTKF